VIGPCVVSAVKFGASALILSDMVLSPSMFVEWLSAGTGGC